MTTKAAKPKPPRSGPKSSAILAPVRRAWRPPDRISPSQWAERYRSLPRGQTQRPGPWRNANAPYLAWIMDVCAVPGVAQLNVLKAAQIGVSEAIRNAIGFFAHQDPDPLGVTLPNRDKGRKIVDNRILPMFRATAPLAELMTERSQDAQREQIKLANGFLMHLMWAGSPAALASDPMRRVFNDEVDKFEAWVGRESDPVSLTRSRLRTYGDRALQINVSTPTNRMGKIYELYSDSGVRLEYQVACPDCGHWQPLVFSGLRFVEHGDAERTEWADLILQSGGAWYECRACRAAWDETARRNAVAAGQYRVPDGAAPIVDLWGEVHERAETVRAWPSGTRIGVQLGALVCLWESMARVAAQFVLAVGSLSKMYSFRTETLGEPFDHQTVKSEVGVFGAKSARATVEEGVVPAWAVSLVATVDTQHTHFWAVLRAWGAGMRSARVWHGRVESFDELDQLLFVRLWPNERADRRAMRPGLVLIDSGGTRLEGENASRTMEVYRWAFPRRSRVRPIKGAPRPKGGVFFWPARGFVDKGARGTKTEMRLWFLDTHHFGDELADAIAQDAPERWELNRRDDPEYNRHLSNAVKIVTRRGAALTEEWAPVGAGARVDLWDCEVYQIAAAYMIGVEALTERMADETILEGLIAPSTPPTDEGRPVRSRGGAWDVTPFRI